MLRNLKNGKLKKGIPEKEKSVDSEKNGSFYQRILSWIQKIKCTFGKLCDKIKALSGKKEKLEEFLRDEVHKGAYHKCKKELFRLMKHLKPKKADVRIIMDLMIRIIPDRLWQCLACYIHLLEDV